MADQATREALITRLTGYLAPGAHNAVLDEGFIGECVDEATALVSQADPSDLVPGEIRNKGIIEAGSALFHKRESPNGISQFAAPDGGALRIARDPMNAVRPLFAPFLPLGFA